MLTQATKNVLMVGGGALGGAGVTGGIWAFFHRRSKKARAAEQAAQEQAAADLQKRVQDYVTKNASPEDHVRDVALILGRQYVPEKVGDKPANEHSGEGRRMSDIPVQKKTGSSATA